MTRRPSEHVGRRAGGDAARPREPFARKIAGIERVTDAAVVLVDAAGKHDQVEISSVASIEGHRFVGVFGQISDVEVEPAGRRRRRTSRRARWRCCDCCRAVASTEQIAQELHLSTETVRNHVRRLISALGVHTRLEAVAVASGTQIS